MDPADGPGTAIEWQRRAPGSGRLAVTAARGGAPMSRPTKLTDAAQEVYLRAIAAGVMPEVAARHADFSPASLYRYRQGTTPRHAAFRAAHDKALASLEIRLTATLAQAALTQPRWALVLLEQRFPERWGRARASDPGDDPDDRSGQAAEAPVSLDPALLDELVPRLLEAGRKLGGRPADDAVDLAEFEDDGQAPTDGEPAERDDEADDPVLEP